jgi:hypothetical protein
MLIEIQCRNSSKFDAALGKYLECGEKMIVSSDDVGQLVTCTKCRQQFEIPFDVGTQSKPKSPPVVSANQDLDPSSSRKPKSARSKSGSGLKPARSPSNPSSQKRRRKGPGTLPGGQKEKRRRQRQADNRPDQGELTLAPAVRRPEADVMSMDFGDQDLQAPLAEGKQVLCKKCGNPSEGGRCTVCHHVEPKFEKLHLPLKDIDIEITGFQRWFCNTMNEGMSVKVLEQGAHILFGALAVLLIIASFLSIGFGVSVFGGLMLLVLVGSLGCLYVGLIFKGHQFLVDPNARLAWFQNPFWNFMLMVSRLMKWQNYDARFKGRKIIAVHDRGFGDRSLADLEGLKTCQVLDLEGTSISDRGLNELYRLKHLHCLVLRKTNVTHDAVFRLQQSFPRLWVWY